MVNWGGRYPPGAANDPAAPYNEPEMPEPGTVITHDVSEAYCADCDETVGPNSPDVVADILLDEHHGHQVEVESWTEEEVWGGDDAR